MSLGRQAARATVVTLSWQAVRILLHLVNVILMSRLLSPTDVGLVAMVIAITGLGELLRDFGLTTAAVQAKSLSHNEKTNLFWVNTLIGGVLSCAFFFGAGLIASLYNDERLIGIAQWASLTFVLNGLATQFKAELNRNLKFSLLGLVEAGGPLLGLLAFVVYAMVDSSYHAIVVSFVVTAISGLVLAVITSGFRPGLPNFAVSITRFLSFGLGLVGTQVTSYITRNGDNVALGYLWGPAVVGVYGLAYNFVMMPMNQILAPLSRVAIPLLGQLRDDDEQFLRSLKGTQTITTVAACLMYGALVGFAQPTVHIVLGPRWDSAVAIIQAMAIGGIFRAMGQVSYWIFVVRGHSIEQFRFHLIAQPLTLAVMLLGLPWGLGVAVGLSVGYAALWLIQLVWAGRVSRLNTTPLVWNGIYLLSGLGLPLMVIPLLISAVLPDPWSIVVSVAAVAGYATIVAILRPDIVSQTVALYTSIRPNKKVVEAPHV